jgi:hypothetical protein
MKIAQRVGERMARSGLDALSPAVLALLFGGWAALALANYALHVLGLDPGTSRTFPISIFRPEPHAAGLPFACAFGVLLGLALRRSARLGALGCWSVGLALVLVGNLAQGDVDAALFAPLHHGGKQYYHDALWISDAAAWLRDFNAAQPALGVHARTHPPFAVLLHSAAMALAPSMPLLATSLVLTLLSSAAIPLVWWTLRALDTPRPRCTLAALLLAILPAFNIYAAVSLDGVIAALAAAFALALVSLASGRGRGEAALLLATSGILANALSFGALFLPGSAMLVGLREAWTTRRVRVLVALAASGILALGIAIWLVRAKGYSHLDAFVIAARLENPGGFLLFADPWRYLATRLEGAAEIALFASLPALALLFKRHRIRAAHDWSERSAAIACSATLVFALMLLCGAYRTGETARGALYLYPFVLLWVRDAREAPLRAAIALAGLQTALMQLAGSYFW